MSAFLLNNISVIMCPHGGMVSHISTSGTSYRVDGHPPLLLGDFFPVVGCPFSYGYASPCTQVTWVAGSTKLLIKSQPALIHTSVGICMSASGAPNGPAVIAAIRSTQREPDSLTIIND